MQFSDINFFEAISYEKDIKHIQTFFNILLSDLVDTLKLQPIYHNVRLVIEENSKKEETASIFDFGVKRIYHDNKIVIKIISYFKDLLPFILLREAYYCFVDKQASELVRICINQIVENDLNKLSGFKKWKKLIRDSLVDKTFIDSELDRLQKFFKIEAQAPLESATQYFFDKIRENKLLCQSDNIDRFYDIIFEGYAYKTSRSLFSPDIIETLRIIIQIFYKTKLYLNLIDYQTLFKKYKENKQINSELSIRKFTESMQWINKCSSIAPSYDYNYSIIGFYTINTFLKFNPLLEKPKIRTLIEEIPFFYLSKVKVNSFALELSATFHVPHVYLEDFLSYFSWLEEFGYIINKKFLCVLHKIDFVNLNYYMDIVNIRKIIDPNNSKYEKKYEIEFRMDYSPVSQLIPLSIFDYTMLERVKYPSITGLTFDKRIETLNTIKGDIENELRKQNDITTEFKDNINNLLKYKSQFLQFLEKHKDHGFFFVYSHLNHMLNYLHLLEEALKRDPEIRNINRLQAMVISQDIEDQILIHNKRVKKIILRDFLPLYFQSKSSFEKEVEKIEIFYKVLNSCYNLKILNLNNVEMIVKELNLAEGIYQTREKKYKKIFKVASLYTITNKKIESWIETFLAYDPPLIKPMLINTIIGGSTIVKYYPEVLLEDTPTVHEKLKELKLYFPRIYIYKSNELFTNKNFIRLLIYFIHIKEKKLFLSLFYSYFKENIIKFNRCFWRGVMRRVKFEARDFYDFENGTFLYLEEIFKQIRLYTQRIFGERMEWPNFPLNNEVQESFWSTKQNVDNLVNTVKNRISHQKIDFNLRELEDFSEFRKNLETDLIDYNNFLDFRAKNFFERYINSIKFSPAFQKFGFSQYSLYFRPFFYRSPTFEIDFNLLFTNSFQNIKYPASIEPDQAIYSEFIFPYRTPNKSYLNWLVKSKKIVSEYCLFYKKKFYEIINFNRNLTKEGWDYSSIRFKSYIQDVLFNPTYDPKISGVREFDISKVSEYIIYGRDTQEFEALNQIYNRHSINIKSYLGTKKLETINYISDLLKKKLIFPYLSLKNLDFQEKVSIILPNVKNEFNEKIIKIFSFFNMCHMYEIEGELYIYGFEGIKPFENGFLIDIWFPKCEMDEFFKVFDLIFQYFKIKHYLILTDLVDGKHLLKSVYGNLEFLDSYNPLKNLIWNDKDEIWMNHKLFNEKFEPIYPDLLFVEKKEE